MDEADFKYVVDRITEAQATGATETSLGKVLAKLSEIENLLAKVVGQPSNSQERVATLDSPVRMPERLEGEPTGPGKTWLNLWECAELSGRSVTTIRRAIKAGVLKAQNVGRGRKRPTYRVHADDLQQYIEAGRVQPSDPPTVPTARVRTKSRHFS